MYLDARNDAPTLTTKTESESATGRDLRAAPEMSMVSRLFATLISSVDRRRLLADHGYFKLVSEIAELLSDEEIALLALYFVPPLAIGIPSREHQLAVSIIRDRRRGKGYA